MNKVYYFTNIFPHYRKPTWKAMLESEDFDLTIFCSKNNPLGIKEIKDTETEHWIKTKRIVKNKGFWLFNRILFWQTSILSHCAFDSYNSIILLGEMNIVSNWIGAIIAKIRSKKVIFWSHGLYGNEGFIKNLFRLTFYRLADYHLTYEKRGRELLIEKGFNAKKIKVIYNSLDFNGQTEIYNNIKNVRDNPFDFFADNTLPVLLFSGRLTKLKKIDLLIDAFLKLNLEESVCNLLIIGDGPEKNNLIKKSDSGIKNASIFFYGSCYDESKLGSLFYYSICTVSPGNIGLTGIHSFSYGTPVITHNNYKHQMPEVESIVEGVNGFFFKEDDIESLIEAIVKVLNSKTDFKPNCREVIEKYYNPEYQIKVLSDLFTKQINQ